MSGNSTTTATIAYNASAATVQTALRALGGQYSGVVVSGSAGGPYTPRTHRAPVMAQPTLGTNSLTGGTSPSVAFATSTAGSNTDTYGPYDSTATDGRQNLVRGYCFILNETVLQSGAFGFYQVPTDHPAVFDGGLVESPPESGRHQSDLHQQRQRLAARMDGVRDGIPAYFLRDWISSGNAPHKE